MGRVSVIIPARNDAADLADTVTSVLSQGDAVVECVIAVGPSADGTEATAQDLAQRHQRVRWVANDDGGIPQGLNLALAACDAPVIVRVDARCTLSAGYIDRALQTMAETGAVNVVSVQVPVGSGPTQRAIAAAMSHPLGSGGASYRSGRVGERTDTGYLGVFDRAALQAIGGWDETMARNEDTELNLRLAASTDRPIWLDPELRVDYRPRPTLRALATQYFAYGRWRQVTARRHKGTLRLRQVIPAAMVAGTLASLIVAIWWPVALLVPAGYVVSMATAAFTTSGLSFGERFRMAAALIVMHTTWGAGFLTSIVTQPR